MGLFFDNYKDCLDKYHSCKRAGDYSCAEAAILKAFKKEHNVNAEGSLYYLLSLAQFAQDKNDLAFSNMEYSANLRYRSAVDFISKANKKDSDDNIDWVAVTKIASYLLASL